LRWLKHSSEWESALKKVATNGNEAEIRQSETKEGVKK